MSDWKPGDVAMVRLDPETEIRVMYNGGHWVGRKGTFYDLHASARRLVVIDPESDEDAERLGELVGKWADRVPYSNMREDGDLTHLDAMQAALREFANPKPPRPEEPTGWGAVVEDRDGHYWTLIAPEAKVWANYSEGRGRYDDIETVRIVHEGVQP